MNREIMRQSPFLSGLPDNDLDWLASQSQQVDLQPGDILIEEGAMGDAAFVLLDGELEVSKKSEDQDVVLGHNQPGDMIGEMSLLNETPRMATIRALRASRLLKIRNETFKQLLAQKSELVMELLHIISNRLQQNEAQLRQSEKMAALGTLTAGLAHELNNPVAAIQRNTQQLRSAMQKWDSAALSLERKNLTGEQRKIISDLLITPGSPAGIQPDMDALKRSDLEGEMQTWLEQLGAASAWESAPTLVEAGWGVSRLKEITSGFDPGLQAVVIDWLASGISLQTIVSEIQVASERVSEIIKSVKAYTYLDQAPVQKVDIREGLDNTLLILHHKLGDSIRVRREYDANLPIIEAYGSALNQVWTNLIDNAIDAMDGKGDLTLRTASLDEGVMVEIGDTGSGIPPEIQKRIFEPFYTTKAPGRGTGLGLNIAYTIVKNHHGNIKVESKPGKTVFQVVIPSEVPR